MRVRLFGGFDLVSPQGQAVRFATRKAALVFAALVLAGKKGRVREALAEAFWPDRGEAQARNSLRQALVDIRRVFPSGEGAAIHIAGDNEYLVLTASDDDVDVWLFDHKASANDAAALAFAADLYVGDLLGAEPASEGVEWFAPYDWATAALPLNWWSVSASPCRAVARLKNFLASVGGTAFENRSVCGGGASRTDPNLPRSWQG